MPALRWDQSWNRIGIIILILIITHLGQTETQLMQKIFFQNNIFLSNMDHKWARVTLDLIKNLEVSLKMINENLLCNVPLQSLYCVENTNFFHVFLWQWQMILIFSVPTFLSQKYLCLESIVNSTVLLSWSNQFCLVFFYFNKSLKKDSAFIKICDHQTNQKLLWENNWLE